MSGVTVEFGGVLLDDPTAVVLLLEGIEVGRKPYSGGPPAVWSAVTLTFDEIVLECADGQTSFVTLPRQPLFVIGGDLEIPCRPDDPWAIPVIVNAKSQ